MSSLDLTGKTIVITGACGALALAIVDKLCALGACIAALDIMDASDAAESFSAYGDRVVYYKCDTADEIQVKETLIN